MKSKKMKNRVVSLSISFVLFLSVSCQDAEPGIEREIIEELKEESFVPDGYKLSLEDNFDFFDSDNWSKGLLNDSDPSIKMIWNKNTGGEHLLNDNYAGYLLDKNTYVKEGSLYLDNVKETIQGTDPVGTFDYSTGWINSLQKINFNGTQKGVYVEIKAKFPKGDKVWPAIWLVDDSENRKWPPEVDIWEYFGKFFKTVRKDQMYMRFIYGTWQEHDDHSVPINNFHSTYKASSEWHVYGYHWTDEKMEWFIDYEKVHTKRKGTDVPAADWPDKPMALVINNGLLRVVDEGNTTFPNSLILDYLAIYEEE